MRKYQKKLVILTAVGALTVGSLSVSAAGLRDVFDAKYYADTYEDLKNAYGYDEEALFNHYVTWGLTEGRSMNPVFDVQAYRNAYGDLNEAFGEDWDAYVNHYFAYGMKEGRNSGILFDPVVYAEAYPDIKEAFGDDYVAILNHYLTYGIQEGRTAGVTVKKEPQVQNISTPPETAPAETTPAETAPAETTEPSSTPTPDSIANEKQYERIALSDDRYIEYSISDEENETIDQYGIKYYSYKEGVNDKVMALVEEQMANDPYIAQFLKQYGDCYIFITCYDDVNISGEEYEYVRCKGKDEEGRFTFYLFVSGSEDVNNTSSEDEIAGRYYLFFDDVYRDASPIESTVLGEEYFYIAPFNCVYDDIDDSYYSISGCIDRDMDLMITMDQLCELTKGESYTFNELDLIYQGYCNIAEGEGNCWAVVFKDESGKTYVVLPQMQNYSEYIKKYPETERTDDEYGLFLNSYMSDVIEHLMKPYIGDATPGSSSASATSRSYTFTKH